MGLDLRTLERDLSRLSCPVHGKPSTIKVVKTSKGFNINTELCCDKMKKKVEAEMQASVGRDIKKQMGDIFKKFGK